ncbi:multicopper oxidase [Actinomadura sp. NBRC 104425]|uniref:multicopper oxidase family protein n=1 Tax=Actinomadura sp. NBRC 104425 TaxID=3032204 RepID=UPI0024A46B8D|nr:multicopper oxidase domain-containing protein [Actinomadura sp. NBRC 104425]GLZ16331.1 multicopper oxidase [Actinomadura sp. NBRC 104425]
MFTRRQILKSGAAAGATAGGGLMLFPARALGATRLRPMDPANIPKYVEELLIPPAMPPVGRRGDIIEYRIAVRQFHQQVLPRPMPRTTVWGYGSVAHPGTFSYPGHTINARVGHPVRVTWINQLMDSRGDFLPSLEAVDPTLHWANPPGGVARRDSAPEFSRTPRPYGGPVPIVTHLHGGHNLQHSDGYPEAWYLPAARNIPRGYARAGSFYDRFRAESEQRFGVRWRPGSATFHYANDQRATTLWYHDHTLGMTRTNVYSGLVGFYLLRGGPSDLPDGVLPGPPPGVGNPNSRRCFDIPILIQDRSFYADGSLFYPNSRAFSGYRGPYIPGTDVPPIWNPEFFGDAIVANGRTWPVLRVEQRRYRLRFLNGCNSRFLILKVADDPVARPAQAALPIWQIGSDGGFLPRPVRFERLQIAPGARFDTVIDFGEVPVGTELWLINEGPDDAMSSGTPDVDFAPADPHTTGQVLKFVVCPRSGPDRSVPPDQLRLPPFPSLGPAARTRHLVLTEEMSDVSDSAASPPRVLLGTVDASGAAVPQMWSDPVTESPVLGSTEIWALRNDTMDAHPIHLHQVQFQVVGHGPDGTAPPGRGDTGYLDTVTVPPRQTTWIKTHFDIPGRFVWHCHMLEHEDNEMMRPYEVVRHRKPTKGDGRPKGRSHKTKH